MKFAIIAFLSLLAMAGGLAWYLHAAAGPPGEASLVAQFQAHRASYEQLRDMLQADEQVIRIASWGVQTTSAPGISVPSTAAFPVDRYNEYLGLLEQAEAIAASRSHGEHPRLCIHLWASGWAGDTRHIAVCWLDQAPADQVADLDDARRTSSDTGGNRRLVFKHVEANWFIQEDW